MKKYILPMLIAFSALAVSATAAFYSITGLSKLFAGASLAVIIMASSLEIAKLVMASFLYQYWEKINKALKIYLSIALVVLILITSMGIYGFLSSAYETTASKNTVIEKQISALEFKKENYTKNRDGYIKDKEQISKSTSELRTALSTGIITQYKDKSGQIINTVNIGNRKAFERQLENTLKEEEKLTTKIDVLNDSVLSLDNQILEIQSNAEVAAELGPLKYISELTNIPMNKIINWLILIIIFVFDPLAVSLVIAANIAFKKPKSPPQEPQLAIYNEKPLEQPEISTPIPQPGEVYKSDSISVNNPSYNVENKPTIIDNFSTWKRNKLISKTKDKEDDIKTY
jgi:hypothetical protein